MSATDRQVLQAVGVAGASAGGGDTAAARRAGSWRAGAAVVLGGTALIVVHALYYGQWVVDDAAITFSYARNLADGHGLVLQPGAAPVEGYSNPAWLALFVVGKLLGLFDRGSILGTPDYVVYPKVLATVCCAGILAGFFLAAREVSRHPAILTLAAGASLALIPSFVIWCYSGLENPLYALLAVWLAVTMLRAVRHGTLWSAKVAVTAGLLAAVAGLTRPDGLIYVASYPLVVAIFTRRSSIRESVRSILVSGVAFAVPYGGYLILRYALFHRLIANTALAKAQSIPSLGDLNRLGGLVQYVSPLTVAVFGACVVASLATSARLRQPLVAVLVPLGLGLLAYCVLNPDWMAQYRFATPVWALGTLAGWLGVDGVLSARGKIGIRAAVAGGLIVALAMSAEGWRQDARAFRASPTIPMCYVADRYGRVINGYGDILRLPSASTVLLPDIGGTALVSQYRIMDLAGLADARIAGYYDRHDMAALRDYIFDDVRPTIIHYHEGWQKGIPQDTRLARDYYLLYSPGSVAQVADWVRKSAVKNQAELAQARAYARAEIPRALEQRLISPLRSCGSRLLPGMTPGT